MGRRDKSVSAAGSSNNALGAALRRTRQATGVSLTALALRLGYTKGHLSAVETGVAWPSRAFVEAYESSLGLPGGELTGLADALLPRRAQEQSAGLDGQGVGQLLVMAREGLGASLPAVEDDRGRQRLRLPAGHGPMSVRGLEAAVTRTVHLLEDAAHEDGWPGKEIITTVHERSSAQSIPPALWDRWQAALRAALERGWDVVQIRRFEGDESSEVALVSSMMQLLGFAGHYQPMSLPESTADLAGYDVTIVPDRGAMLMLSTQSGRYPEAAFFFADPEDIAVFRDHAEVLRARATPVLKVYKYSSNHSGIQGPYPDLVRYDIAFTNAHLKPGDKYLVKDGLSSLIIPTSVFQNPANHLIQRGGSHWRDLIRLLAENRTRRSAALHEHVKTWKFRDICTKRSIERLATDDLYVVNPYQIDVSADGEEAIGEHLGRPADHAEKIRYVEAAIGLLKTYPNYEIGLVDDPMAEEVGQNYWQVKGKKGDSVVFLDTWSLEGSNRIGLKLEITQPAVVEAFRSYFLSLWRSLPERNRDKSDVIAWLEGQISRIRLTAPPD